MKRILLSLFTLVLLHFEIGLAQSTDFPNVLDKGGIQVLCKSAVAVSAPADTSEDTLATCTVPANSMGANGQFRVRAWWTYTNSANNKTLRVRFGGTIFLGPVLTTTSFGWSMVEIFNRNATNSQFGSSEFFNASQQLMATSGITTAVDTTAASTILITCQKATAGETCTLESFLVELMPSN